MKAYLEDTNRWFVIENYTDFLTLEELNLINSWIEEVDSFYGSKVFNEYYFPRLSSTKLKPESTRLDAVKQVLLGSEYYAAKWDYKAISWVSCKLNFYQCFYTQQRVKQVLDNMWINAYKKEDYD